MKITGIDIHTYPVDDADRAVAFYRDVLGLTPSMHWPGMGAEFELADGSTFGLWKTDDMPPGGGVMFAVPSVAEAVAELRAKGITVEDPMEHEPCFMAMAEDTEGNQIILHQRK